VLSLTAMILGGLVLALAVFGAAFVVGMRRKSPTEEITGHTLNAPYAQIRPLLNALPAQARQRPTRAATGRHTAAATARSAAKPNPQRQNPRPTFEGRGFVPEPMVGGEGLEPPTSCV
jgi:hypothetical protein